MVQVILFLLLPVLLPLLLVLEVAVSVERWAHETLAALRRSRPPAAGSGEATGRAGRAASRAPVFLAGDVGVLLAIFLLAGLGIALLLWGQGEA
jgi:hypothetical protein